MAGTAHWASHGVGGGGTTPRDGAARTAAGTSGAASLGLMEYSSRGNSVLLSIRGVVLLMFQELTEFRIFFRKNVRGERLTCIR